MQPLLVEVHNVMSIMSVARNRAKAEQLKHELYRVETYLQPTTKVRCVTAVYKKFLLNTGDPYFYGGLPYTVKGKSLGAGVYELSLIPYEP